MAASNAFDLTKYFTSGFKNVGTDAASLKSAADSILASQGKFSAGNTSYLDWANQANRYLTDLSKLDDAGKTAKSRSTLNENDKEAYDRLNDQWVAAVQSARARGIPTATDTKAAALRAQMDALVNDKGRTQEQYLLDEAARWLTGSAQPTRASRVLEKYAGGKKELEKDIQNELSNIANVMDFSGGNLSSDEIARLTARGEAMKAALQPKIDLAKTYYGIDVTPMLTRLPSGFVPTSEAPATPAAPAASAPGAAGTGAATVTDDMFRAGLTEQQKVGIRNLVSSNRAFSDTDAKNFAYAVGRDDWQSFVGKNGQQILGMASGSPTAKPANDSVSGLFSRVEGTNGQLTANKDFVNGAVQAYLGRPATAQELANLTGKTVEQVRSTIKAGIPGGAGSTAATAASTGSSPSSATPADPDLAAKVEAAQGSLTANKDFVNAAFRAYHGRDATAAELSQLTGQSVDAVRAAVKAGAPGNAGTAGSAAPAGDRLLGPTEFEKLRKEYGVSDANFDQFFRRDAQGNIYLRGDAFSNRSPFTAASASDINTPANAGDLFRSEFDMNNLTNGGDNLASFVAGLNALWDLTKSETQKQLETERADLTQSLKDATNALKNKGTRTREEEEKLGLSANTKALQEINKQIAAKMAEYQAADLKIRQQPITTGLIEGQQRQLMEQKAIDMGVLFMQQAALTDNINLAQEIAGHIVDLEFAPIEQEIANAQTFLEMNSQDLTREESKQASKIEGVLAERARILEEQKAEKQLIAGLMIDIAKAGGDPRILDYGASFEENLAKAAPYLVTPADTKRDTQVVELPDGSKYLIDSQTGERIASFGDTNDNDALGFDSWLDSIGGTTPHVITQGFDNPVDYIAGRDIHGGLDIDGEIGDPLSAPVSGRVVSAGPDGGWGNSIIIEDAAGNRWRMAHLDAIDPSIKPDKYISAGMNVGTLGNTGHVEASEGGNGSHLHLEVKDASGNLIDPRGLMTATAPKNLTPEQIQQETTLRGEFNKSPITTQYNDLRTSYSSMNEAWNFAQNKGDSGSKASADQALVTLFNKMLDPTSVVREAEYARSAEGQSALARAQGYTEMLLRGGSGLTDENRKDMVDIAQKLFASTANLYNQNSNYYRGLAQAYNLDPNRIVAPTFSTGTETTAPESGGSNLGDLNWGAGSGSESPYTVDLSDLNFIFGPTAP